jgi:hypothetical protein
MIKHTQHFLDKLVHILELNGYVVRNEKGNFKSGHCLKDESRVILLNKVAPIESRITFLCDTIRNLQLDDQVLSADERKLLGELKQTVLEV